MESQQVSAIKFENSPAESFVSTPGENYSSLFSASSPSATDTMNPMEMMTPQSFSDDKQSSRLSAVPEEDDEEDDDDTSAPSDKKAPKKRKSWGQVLPEPKTNLPPRKRAKTEDEKEQRRVERVLRNRRAAQSSRERKRLEVEALETRNKELEDMLINAQKANLALVEELNRFRRDSGVVTRSSSPLDTLRDNQVTLSQELFSSQDGHNALGDQSGAALDELMMTSNNPTVNPASLSPELSPVDEQITETSSEDKTPENALATTDLTQRPAEMLCDLQCQSSAKVPKSFQDSQTPISPLLVFSLQLKMMLCSASAILSACQRPLTQIAMSSKAGFSLLPSPQILATIIWLVTIPQTSTSSTSTTSSTTRQTTSPQTLWQRATTPLRTMVQPTRSTTLRLKSLRKILSSSPTLARPLLDATMVALRLVSEGHDDRVENLWRESYGTRDEFRQLTQCLRQVALPSKEVLLTLLWALKVEERRIQRKKVQVVEPESGALDESTERIILKVARRKQVRQQRASNSNRYRLR